MHFSLSKLGIPDMNRLLTASAFTVACLLSVAVQAEVKVTLTKMHLCCGACVKAVNGAVAGVDGAEVKVDKKAKSATITATSADSAQAAVNAIASAGFHGVSDNDKIGLPKVKTPDGNVKRIVLTGVHNCCGGCNVAIKKALKTVDGIEESTNKPKESRFVVEGDFNALKLIQSLNTAGFHVKVGK